MIHALGQTIHSGSESMCNFKPLDFGHVYAGANNPIKALYWSAVINGVVAVPVMAVMMVMTGDRQVMGRFTVRGPLRVVGWIATACMAASVFGMVLTTLSQASAFS